MEADGSDTSALKTRHHRRNSFTYQGRLIAEKYKMLYLPKRPKRPMNAYLAFVKEYFARGTTNKDGRKNMHDLTEKWRKMTTEEKQKYEDKVTSDRERYKREIAIWNRNKERLKRPATPYAMFVRDVWERERSNGTALDLIEMSCLASELWRNLPVQEKNRYTQKYGDQKRLHDAFMIGVRGTGRICEDKYSEDFVNDSDDEQDRTFDYSYVTESELFDSDEVEDGDEDLVNMEDEQKHEKIEDETQGRRFKQEIEEVEEIMVFRK